jgi:hypothetical protein
LVGIVSHFSEDEDECEGTMARPHLALPVWAVKKIKSRRTGEFW